MFDFHAICDKVCQFPAAGRRFPPCTPVSSVHKTDCHEITHCVTSGVESDVKPHQTNKQIVCIEPISLQSFLKITHNIYNICLEDFNFIIFRILSIVVR